MADWIALGLLIVAGVSAAGTIVSIVLNHRSGADRLASEERRHTERLASDERRHEARLDHERREASLAAAAKAYRLVVEVLRHVTLVEIEHRVAAQEGAMGADALSSVVTAADALEIVTATGWNEEVRESAGRLLVYTYELDREAFMALSALQRSAQGTEIEDQFDTAYSLVARGLAEFQQAIAET